MDPNAALESILRGHMMAEHVDALAEWMRTGGFAATGRIPVDCHEAFAGWSKDDDVIARKTGILGYRRGGSTVHITWNDLATLLDSEY